MNIYSINNLSHRLYKRYISKTQFQNWLNKIDNQKFILSTIGYSVLNEEIFKISFGKGHTRIFMWSQMHGNETTTTRAIFSWLDNLSNNDAYYHEICENYTIEIIPILNPDGAWKYTRANHNQVDINRDAVNQSEPEMKVLIAQIKNFQPHFALNMHDQRSIFGLKDKYVASLSFLAPSFNVNRAFNTPRLKAANVVAKIYNAFPKEYINYVGRFDDAFNINCIGDYLMAQDIPTILWEAGHFPNDYERNNCVSLVVHGLQLFFEKANNIDLNNFDLKSYTNIPENVKIFNDIHIISESGNNIEKLQFKEVLNTDSQCIDLIPEVIINQSEGFKYAHYYQKK